MYQRIARVLLTILCLSTSHLYALETDKQQAMSQACGFTAGRQQQYVMTQMQGAVLTDKAGLAEYRDLLRYSSPSARNAMRVIRTGDSAMRALDDQSFNDAVNLGIVLQSEPAIAAQARRQVDQRTPDKNAIDAERLPTLREVWTGLCLQQLQAGASLARTRERALCNTFAVMGLMQRQSLESMLRRKVPPEQVEGMLRSQPESRAMIDDTVALAWVDGEMESVAIHRAASIAGEAPAKDVSNFRKLAQQLAKDPLQLPYGSACEAMANGARPMPSSPPAGALVEIVPRSAVRFRPNLSDYYPRSALLANIQGRVTVRICFNTSGTVTESVVTESSGWMDLDNAASKYVMKLRFWPALVDFVPRGECTNQAVLFRAD